MDESKMLLLLTSEIALLLPDELDFYIFAQQEWQTCITHYWVCSPRDRGRR
jgi:hypothetical protein